MAVKRLFLNTRQWIQQFFNEVDLISQVRHRNLVKLLGCCLDGPESLLVYEFYPNRSLDLFLFSTPFSLSFSLGSFVILLLIYWHISKKFILWYLGYIIL